MMRILTLIGLAFLIYSCKPETKEQKVSEESSINTTEKSIVAEKIALAHGFENWNNVNQIKFRFNVERNGNVSGRYWTWNPKTDDVTLISDLDTITYNRKSVDKISLSSDKGFINDKFWLLVPFQLVWDEHTTISEPVEAEAPLSKKEMNKITLTYGNKGGYTPGDAYDIFYDNEFLIREWVFRKRNSKIPTMVTTFENHKTYKGITIATDHKMPKSNFNLFFSDIEVK